MNLLKTIQNKFLDSQKKFLLFVVIIPPSPEVIILLPYKLNTPASPSPPTFLPLISAPCASAASSMTKTLFSYEYF